MNDLISRQAAIDALAKEMPSLTTPDGCGEFDHDIQITDEAFVDCMQIINELPSAQPERKQGEWVLQSDDYHEYYECDQCGIAVGLDDVRNYYPNCGADMRGE